MLRYLLGTDFLPDATSLDSTFYMQPQILCTNFGERSCFMHQWLLSQLEINSLFVWTIFVLILWLRNICGENSCKNSGFCPGLPGCLHFFNQIQANNAILHYFMVRLKNFLGRVVFFCRVVVRADQCRPAGAEHWKLWKFFTWKFQYT
jgi:hypothetical protein